MTINVQLTLNPSAVGAPALCAVRDTLEIISICFPAIDSANAIPPLRSDGMDFRMEPRNPREFQELRPVYKQWVLSKGFQELARGLRQSLEEAHLYIEVARIGGNTMRFGELEAHTAAIRSKANKVDFPTLTKLVNTGLAEKMHFEREFHSLIKTRNCLEHRHGIVGDRDIDKETGVLTLSLPRMKVFFVHDGVETELAAGQRFEKDTEICMKRGTTDTHYNRGDRISFTVDDFKRIAFGCWCFSQDLMSKLPKLPDPKAVA